MIKFSEYLCETLTESLDFDKVSVKTKITPKQFKDYILSVYTNPEQIKQANEYINGLSYVDGYSFAVNGVEYWVYMENSNGIGEFHLLDVTNSRYGIGDIPLSNTDGLKVYAGALKCISKCLEKWSPDIIDLSAPSKRKERIYGKLFDLASSKLESLSGYKLDKSFKDSNSVDGSVRFTMRFKQSTVREGVMKPLLRKQY